MKKNSLIRFYQKYEAEKLIKIEKEKIINEILEIDFLNISSKEAFDILLNFKYRLKN